MPPFALAGSQLRAFRRWRLRDVTWACSLSPPCELRQAGRKVFVAVIGNGQGPAQFIEAYTGKAMKSKVAAVSRARALAGVRAVPLLVGRRPRGQLSVRTSE